MFCTSGGNSASVMSMRFVFNFIFFFSDFIHFGGPPRLPSRLESSSSSSSSFSPFCPSLFLLLFLLPFPQPLCSSSGPEEAFLFTLIGVFVLAPRPAGAEARPGWEKQAEPGRAAGAERPADKQRSEKAQTPAKFLCRGVAPNRRRQGES